MMNLGAFLFWLAGASRDVLATCPRHERMKYTAVGTAVFLTGVWAVISSGYALQRALGNEIPYPILLLLALMWGFTVVNIDRMCIMTMPDASAGFWTRLRAAVPRLFLALVIAMVIAKPLEVRVFINRIALERQVMKDEELAKSKKQIDTGFGVDTARAEETSAAGSLVTAQQAMQSGKGSPALDILSANHRSLEEDQRRVESEVEHRLGQVKAAVAGLSRERSSVDHQLSLLQPGYDIGQRRDLLGRRRALETRIERLSDESSDLIARRTAAREATRDAFTAMQQQAVTEHQEQVRTTDSLRERAARAAKTRAEQEKIALERLHTSASVIETGYGAHLIADVEALGRLTAREPFGAIWWASILIQLLFVTIETAPVFSKLMMKMGPYDFQRHTADDEFAVRAVASQHIHADEQFGMFAEQARDDAHARAEHERIDAVVRSHSIVLDKVVEFTGRQIEARRRVLKNCRSDEDAGLRAEASSALDRARAKFMSRLHDAIRGNDRLREDAPDNVTPIRPTSNAGADGRERDEPHQS
jgi:hypothetical protein